MDDFTPTARPPAPIAIALGSNLGDRALMLREACAALSSLITITDASRIYETAAAYVTDQPAFLNAVLVGTTTLQPLDLLSAIKNIETELGRVKTIRYGPRAIDIDILFYSDLVMKDAALQIPHPRMAERSFVLYPLADVAPNWLHPETGQSVVDMMHKQIDPDIRTTDTVLDFRQ